MPSTGIKALQKRDILLALIYYTKKSFIVFIAFGTKYSLHLYSIYLLVYLLHLIQTGTSEFRSTT